MQRASHTWSLEEHGNALYASYASHGMVTRGMVTLHRMPCTAWLPAWLPGMVTPSELQYTDYKNMEKL